jgi:hypothetical protein
MMADMNPNPDRLPPFSRRQFLQLGGLAACALALPPFPPDVGADTIGMARVTSRSVYLWSAPSFSSRRLLRLQRDQIITFLEFVRSDAGPRQNALWYRTPDGYVHSGNLQLVRWEPQVPEKYLPEEGALFEVSVPYTRSHREPDNMSALLYRLYYQSTAWVMDCVDDALGRSWYKIYDDRMRTHYYVRAEHLRRIPAHELTPISPEIPAEDKRIEVYLSRQELRAFEGDRLVLCTLVSSGAWSTKTPEGRFFIYKKTAVRHMGDGHLTSDLDAYELPGVPWCCFFHITGVAFHGAYWHNDFGRPRSHGCVNMQYDEAKWLYRWSMPSVEIGKMAGGGRGTTVYVY